MKVSATLSSRIAQTPAERQRSAVLRQAMLLIKANDYRQLLSHTEQALDTYPDDAEIWNLHGFARYYSHADSGDDSHDATCSQASQAFQRARKLRPDYREASLNHALVSAELGRFETAVDAYRHALQLGEDAAAHSALLTVLQRTELDPAALLAAYRHFGRLYGQKKYRHFTNTSNLERPLRVGYVCGELLGAPASALLHALLPHHDHSRFQVHVFSMSGDEAAAPLRPLADMWHDIRNLNDKSVWELVRKFQIDVLVDLVGHAPHNRLPVFGMRAAPVQLTWTAEATTTGLEEVDYCLIDSGQAEHSDLPATPRHSEALYPLPGCTYPAPPEATLPPAPPAGADALTRALENAYYELYKQYSTGYANTPFRL